MTANFDENSSSCEYQLSSKIQETSGGTEDRKSKTSRGGQSQRIKNRKNTKQKKNKRSCKILGVMKNIYSRTQYMGKEERLREYKGSNSKI